jgi:hypothetical protein
MAALERHYGDYCMTVRDAAKIAAVCPRTIWREIERGKLHAVRFSENRVRVLASEMARYLAGDSAA